MLLATFAIVLSSDRAPADRTTFVVAGGLEYGADTLDFPGEALPLLIMFSTASRMNGPKNSTTCEASASSLAART